MPHLLTQIGGWDIALILIVSMQATLLAYLYSPKLKALLLALPFPFTLATMAVGRQIDATNVLGMLLLLSYTYGVTLLHYCCQIPIFLSIGISVAGYCLIGSFVAPSIGTGSFSFWLACLGVGLVGFVISRIAPAPEEEGSRCPCPVWIKLPAVMLVVFCLVLIKKSLHGFTTMFPMVGVIASYEGRMCLWTISRQIPIVILTMLPMMIVCRIAYPHVGLAGSLALGWLFFLAGLAPSARRTLRESSTSNPHD